MVKELREKTGLPMMECKEALTECDANVESAIEWLRRKHKGKLDERADRDTGEGRVAVYIDENRKVGAIVELRCETVPVAKNEMFVDLANAFARKVADGSEASPDVEAVRNDPDMDAKFTEVFGKMRENMKLAGCRRVEGAHLASYIHHDGKSGLLLSLSSEPKSEKPVAADLCMHAVFTKPLAIMRDGIPAEEVEKVRERARQVALDEGKPEHIIEKIVPGKVNAFFAEKVLWEQLHVKTDAYGKTKVGDVLKQSGVDAITDLVIMKIGV